jgi:hypothetical protein
VMRDQERTHAVAEGCWSLGRRGAHGEKRARRAMASGRGKSASRWRDKVDVGRVGRARAPARTTEAGEQPLASLGHPSGGGSGRGQSTFEGRPRAWSGHRAWAALALLSHPVRCPIPAV